MSQFLDFGEGMAPVLQKLLRGTLLGLMLLLAGTANLVCISYDADNDDTTPPVSMELNIVIPSKRSVHVPKPHSQVRRFRLRDEKPSTELLATAVFESAPQISQGSPELLVPLRR